MRGKRTGRCFLLSGAVLAILIFTMSLFSVIAMAGEHGQTDGKHLVIKVVEDSEEELFDLEDGAVPLAAFPGASQSTQKDTSGRRHLVLMAVMLCSVIAFVLYHGKHEKKLIRLRQKAAQAEYGWMVERNSSPDYGKQ